MKRNTNVKRLPRETAMTKDDKAKSIDAMRERRAYKLGRSDERFSYTSFGSSYRKQRDALQRARKQTRELKREVTRLTAIVVSQAEKLV